MPRKGLWHIRVFFCFVLLLFFYSWFCLHNLFWGFWILFSIVFIDLLYLSIFFFFFHSLKGFLNEKRKNQWNTKFKKEQISKRLEPSSGSTRLEHPKTPFKTSSPFLRFLPKRLLLRRRISSQSRKEFPVSFLSPAGNNPTGDWSPFVRGKRGRGLEAIPPNPRPLRVYLRHAWTQTALDT